MSTVTIKDLIEHSIFDIDEDQFFEKYQATVRERDLLSPLAEFLVLIERPELALSASGGGIIGGGFGLEGAAQGMAIAAAANLLTGTISAANANARRATDKQKIANFIKRGDTRRRVFETISAVALAAQDVFLEILQVKTGVYIERPSLDDEKKAKAIVRNVAKGRLPAETMQAALLEAIKLNPYDPLAYIVLHLKALDPGGVEDLTDFLDLDYESYASSSEAEELIGISEARKIGSLEDAIINIISNYPNKDLYLYPNIPDRKLKNAQSSYFNEKIFADTHVKFPESDEFITETNPDPGDLIALIDCTLFGSANDGIAFGSGGIAWKNASAPVMMSWSSFSKFAPHISRGLMGVKLAGQDMSLSGSDFKVAHLLEVLKEIAAVVDSRPNVKADAE